MKFNSLITKALPLLAAGTATAVQIAHPHGPWGIGTLQYDIPKTSENDPTAPDGTGDFIVVTAYYPTCSKTHKKQPYFDPASAKIWEDALKFPNGSLSTLDTVLQPNAPFLSHWETPKLPTLIFSPGGGVNSYMYYGIMSHLVSHGYTIMAIDHPGEPPNMLLPNGTNFEGLSIYTRFNLTTATQIYNFRVTDIAAAVEDWPRFVHHKHAPFNTTHYVPFGHSVGGAASAGSAAIDEKFLGGINLDGGLYEPYPDVAKPFLIMTSINHTAGFDPSLIRFTEVQTGWWEELSVYDSAHLDYSDLSLWTAALGLEGKVQTPETGMIGGRRMQEIVRKFVPDFLDYLLGNGNGHIFTHPSLKWNEVVYVNGSNF